MMDDQKKPRGRSRDFTAQAPTGIRVRISMQIYDRPSGQFKVAPGIAARITVDDDREQAALWQAIETTIESGAWRHERHRRRRDRPAGVPDSV